MKNSEGVSGEDDCEAKREKINLLKMSGRDALWCDEFWEVGEKMKKRNWGLGVRQPKTLRKEGDVMMCKEGEY